MPIEIERKFLVTDTAWRQARSVRVRQGFLNLDPARTVRVRLADGRAFLTIKGLSRGASRAEFEYEIPLADAEQLLALCAGSLIDKVRYFIDYKDLTWEVDEFLGANAGLVIAEVELEREDQLFERPPWVGKEVTGDPRYYNATLAAHPYGAWSVQPDA